MTIYLKNLTRFHYSAPLLCWIDFILMKDPRIIFLFVGKVDQISFMAKILPTVDGLLM